MRKSYFEKKIINASLEVNSVNQELKPKQSTIDFLIRFSKVYYVEELEGDLKMELFLN